MSAAEARIGLVKGTADVQPDDFASLAGLQGLLLERFARAGYRPIRVPVLEDRALHERKSGARIVANLYQVAGGNDPVCLRPELTAGIVRAFIDAPEQPLPWRVSYAGPVFRHLPTAPGTLREFQQVGVERLDDPESAGGDAEAIWLADWSLAEAGIADATIRVGHAGLIQELLRRSGLPLGVQVALVEVLAEAAGGDEAGASEDRVLSAAESHLDALAKWLGSGSRDEPSPPGDAGADRLYRTLYPEVVGRRSGRDVIGRLRRKWDLGHGLAGVLAKVRERIRTLADLRGPATAVLERMGRYGEVVPELTRELTGLVEGLRGYGVAPGKVELDLGFGRGIGFYSQMVFVLIVETPDGPVEVCGGGRYDGLARALGSSRDVGGVGFAFGLERLRDVLHARGKAPDDPAARDRTLLVAWGPAAYGIAARLRATGRAVVVEEGEAISPESARARGFSQLLVPEGESLRCLDLATGASADVGPLDEMARRLAGAER